MDEYISEETFRMALDNAMKKQNITSKERGKRIGELLVCTPIEARDGVIDIEEGNAIAHEQERRKPSIPSEFTEQCNFVNWFRHTYPGVILMSIRNGGYRQESERQSQMLEGLYPGVADLFCPEFNLWIEFKKIKNYVWKPEQKQFKEDIESIGHKYILAIGCDNGKDQIIPFIGRKIRERECSNLLSK